MFDTYKMQEMVCKEMEKKAERGSIPSQADLDTIWKLVDVYKNLLKIDMLQEAGEYSHDGGYSRGDGDYSERRRRDARGRYSRNDGYERGSSYNDGHGGYSAAHDRYMEKKHSYRTSRTPEAKRELLDSMEDFLDELETMFRETKSGADTREERDKIQQRVRDMVNKM